MCAEQASDLKFRAAFYEPEHTSFESTRIYSEQDCYALNFVAKGCVDLKLNDVWFRLDGGDCWCVAPGGRCFHGAGAVGETYSFRCVAFQGSRAAKWDAGNLLPAQPISLPKPLRKHVAQELDAVIALIKKRDAAASAEAAERLETLLRRVNAESTTPVPEED